MASPPPPFEVNSNGSTPTPGRGLVALGLATDFLRVRHELGEDSMVRSLLITIRARINVGMTRTKKVFIKTGVNNSGVLLAQ